jgi:DNA repair protein RecO (recombination protein O)
VATNGESPGRWTVGGQTLLDIARDDYVRADTREEARRLLRALIAQRLGGQALHTRAVLMELQEL